MEHQLWNRYWIASDDRNFVEAKILDKIAGKKLIIKYGTELRLVSQKVDGTISEVSDLVQKLAIPRQRSHSIAEAAAIMQMLILWGLFSETLLPEDSFFRVINHRNRSTPPLEQLGTSSVRGTSSRTPTSTASATSQPLAQNYQKVPQPHPSYSIFETSDSPQDYSEESTGNISTVAHSKNILKILATSSVLR